MRGSLPRRVRRTLHPLRVRLDPRSPRSSRRKRRTIRRYARRFGTPVLVETGTYLGTTVDALRDSFERVYSIELDTALYERAQARFAGDDRIRILQGDSGKLLGKLAQEIEEPCLFWLDAHFSDWDTARGMEPSPLRSELVDVFARRNADDVVLVDDARLLTGQDGYPTVDEIRALAGVRRFVEVDDDIVRVHRP